MPGDSLYIVTRYGDTGSIEKSDTGIRLTQAVLQSRTVLPEPETNDALVGFMVLGGYLLLLLSPLLLHYLYKHVIRKAINMVKIYRRKEVVYDNLLHHYVPYYRNLSTPYQQRFLKRTLTFMAVKDFKFVEMEEEPQMSLLISAAAVQITFGLEHYLLDYFETIYVLPDMYQYGQYKQPFEGHVNHQGIYLSWNNFLRAYANYNDGDNVGLHEMAHALTFVNFHVNDGEDKAFKKRFQEFSVTGRAVLARLQAGENLFLGSYAATNYEEFWAVCVENFFERPQLFCAALPELYNAMCKLLNQDLLTDQILLSPVQDIKNQPAITV